MEKTDIIRRLLAIFTLVLTGILALPPTANAADLPDCKKNPGCLVDDSIDWKTITVADVQTMINAGADVNATGDVGLTPLHYAAPKGTAKLISVLINAGADVNAKGHAGWTPLHLAAWAGNPKSISPLVNNGAYLEEKDEASFTPLHLAAFSGKGAAVSALIKEGADPNAEDKTGATPLDLAISPILQRPHYAVGKILRDAGGKCNKWC